MVIRLITVIWFFIENLYCGNSLEYVFFLFFGEIKVIYQYLEVGVA